MICVYVYYVIHKSQSNLEAFQGCDVPKIIWCYWDSDNLPPLIKTFTDCWKFKLKSWTVNVITPSTINKHLSKEIKKPTHLIPAHFADWLRLYLLRDHGGVWIDASTIIENEQALDRYYTEFCQSGKELFGFHAPAKWYPFWC